MPPVGGRWFIHLYLVNHINMRGPFHYCCCKELLNPILHFKINYIFYFLTTWKLSTPRSASGTLLPVCHENSVLCNMAMDICILRTKEILFSDEFSLKALYLRETIPCSTTWPIWVMHENIMIKKSIHKLKCTMSFVSLSFKQFHASGCLLSQCCCLYGKYTLSHFDISVQSQYTWGAFNIWNFFFLNFLLQFHHSLFCIMKSCDVCSITKQMSQLKV